MGLLDNEKVQEVFLIIGDSLQGANRKWWYFFAGVLIMILPLYYTLQIVVANVGVASYSPPALVGQAERLPLEEVEKKFIKISGDTYSGYVKIRNPNLDWGIPNMTYRIEIRASDSSLLSSSTNETFILPSSEKFLVLPRFTSSKIPTQIDFSVLGSKFVAKPDFPRIGLELQRSQVQVIGNDTVTSGVIRNASPFTVTKVDILAIVYNERSEIVGINYTNINDLVSSELRSFQMSWPAKLPGRLHPEISTELNIYDKGLLKTQGPVSPF